MKILTGFAVVNCEIGKKIAFTYSVVNPDGAIEKSNNKESFVVLDENILNAIKTIEDVVNARITSL